MAGRLDEWGWVRVVGGRVDGWVDGWVGSAYLAATERYHGATWLNVTGSGPSFPAEADTNTPARAVGRDISMTSA